MDSSYRIPITGELDLHLFRPGEVKELVPEYLRECRTRGILQVRVIHGKGKGVLMQMVHRSLDRLDFVVDYSINWGGRGGWGATTVQLKPA
ncbi:MAG: Smr/MutS family protein [Spirochaeta sp.]